ncbi:MAG: hypothetical protein Q8P67_23475 [archaeon]|nr:hypothetical protein [archaeon]
MFTSPLFIKNPDRKMRPVDELDELILFSKQTTFFKELGSRKNGWKKNQGDVVPTDWFRTILFIDLQVKTNNH